MCGEKKRERGCAPLVDDFGLEFAEKAPQFHNVLRGFPRRHLVEATYSRDALQCLKESRSGFSFARNGDFVFLAARACGNEEFFTLGHVGSHSPAWALPFGHVTTSSSRPRGRRSRCTPPRSLRNRASRGDPSLHSSSRQS